MANFKANKKKTQREKSEKGSNVVKANLKNNAKRKPEPRKTFLVHPYEYNMSAAMANDYLAYRKAYGSAEEKKMSKYQYLCHVVNEQHGLIGTCVKVHII